MKYIKIILVTGLLFCLVDMPYGYYTLIRFASAIIFGIMAGYPGQLDMLLSPFYFNPL